MVMISTVKSKVIAIRRDILQHSLYMLTCKLRLYHGWLKIDMVLVVSFQIYDVHYIVADMPFSLHLQYHDTMMEK